MKRKRLIAAFLSLMLVVTVVMPAASATGYTGLWSSVENTQTEGETPATETPAEDTGTSDEGTDQTPTDPDDTDTSDEGTEQTPSDPDDTDTSDEGTEQTPTDPDDTDTSDEETATDPDDTDTSDEETPDTPAEEPTEPETPVEEPTEPETPTEDPPVVEEPTEPETPTEEPTVPMMPEQLPAEEIPAEPLAEGDNPLTIYFVDTEGNPIQDETTTLPNTENYIKDHDSSDWENVPEYNLGASYTLQGVYANRQNGTAVTGIRYIEAYVEEGWFPWDEDITHPATWQYRYDNGRWGTSSDTLTALYLVYDDGSVTLSFDGNGGQGYVNSLSGQTNTSVTLPENGFTRSGYTFVGWAEQAVTLPDDTYTGTIYEPGASYTMPEEDTTLYAVWENNNASTTAYFYIRLDGEIPYEPGEYQAADYTAGIEVTGAITEQHFIGDNEATDPITSEDGHGYYVENDVTNALNRLPTTEQIQTVIDYYNYHREWGDEAITYNPDEYYIQWYVQKHEGASELALLEDTNSVQDIQSYGEIWHIDGVLLKRGTVRITYHANPPAGVTQTINVPQGYTEQRGTEISVGESGRVGSGHYTEPSIAGYTFLGWTTNRDGSGTVYQQHDLFTLNVDTTMYAQWRKGTGTALVLTKKDGLGNNLAGATFTISAANGTNETLTGDASHTVDGIETDTVYTITETAAPEGYQLLENSTFHFKVESNNDMMDAYLCNEQGTKVDNVQGVELSYDSGSETVYIDVTNIGYFYIFHTADSDRGVYVEEIPINGDNTEGAHWNGDDTYDITAHVTPGFYYGGYYHNYSGTGNYSDENPADGDVTGATTYKGSLTAWNGMEPFTANGERMTPVAGETYYLKEVPEEYFAPYMAVVYDKYKNPYMAEQLYLISATDDKNYKEFGILCSKNGYDEEKLFTLAFTFQYSDGTKTSITAKSAFGVPTGYLGVWDATDELSTDNNFSFHAYVVTPDGVTVKGFKTRTIHTGDLSYDPEAGLDGGSGISKADD